MVAEVGVIHVYIVLGSDELDADKLVVGDEQVVVIELAVVNVIEGVVIF